MKNLLESNLAATEIATILKATTGRSALPRLDDAVWHTQREAPAVASWLPELIARAEAEADQPLPELTDALYEDFFKTGDRLPFEKPYFERRRRLGRAAIAVLLGDPSTRARLLPSFLAKLTAILDECSWTLPAHVWEEPTGKDPMHIDLFAAECANNFAEMLVVLNTVIPDKLATRIRSRLHSQFFENYANREPAFHWTTIHNNWNAVCHQGVLGAALAIEEDHDLVARMLHRAAASLPHYLSGFGEDGSTSEGPGYWSYGFGWFSELNAQLEHRTEGELSLFVDNPKIQRMARFAPQLTLANGHRVNFSDGSRTGTLAPPLLTYLGERLDDPMLQSMGKALYQKQIKKSIDLDQLRRDFFSLSRQALRAPTDPNTASQESPEQPDVYFPDYGAIVARGTDNQGNHWELAAKAGHNDEHHNHNDCGSWLLNVNGHPACLEIGAPEYTHDFFNEGRYTFLAARSLGHSVPYVNGHEQAAGREFAATVLETRIGEDRVEWRIDLSKAYPSEAGCQKLHRTWLFEKSAGRLTVTDHYTLDEAGTFETILIAPPNTVCDGEEARITTEGVQLRIHPNEGTRITAVESCDYRGHNGTDEQVCRIRMSPTVDAASGTAAYSVLVSSSS